MFRKVSNASKKVSNASGKVSNASEKVSNASEKASNAFKKYLPQINNADLTEKFIASIEQVYGECGTDMPFGQANVMKWLNCSKSKATNVMNAMKAAGIIVKVTGLGPGRYKFIKSGEGHI